jgi:hypothetical protein
MHTAVALNEGDTAIEYGAKTCLDLFQIAHDYFRLTIK